MPIPIAIGMIQHLTFSTTNCDRDPDLPVGGQDDEIKTTSYLHKPIANATLCYDVQWLVQVVLYFFTKLRDEYPQVL